MRNIKFRAKNTLNNWVFGWINQENDNYYINGYNAKKETISQFSDFQDKNKKDIYEGDIIRYHAKVLLVRLSVGDGVCLEVLNKPFVDNWRWDSGRIIGHQEDIEIIGNYIDNPELFAESKYYF